MTSISTPKTKSRMEVYFSIGTNQGDREHNIREAISRMDQAFGRTFTRMSSIIETEAWGFKSDPFLNCAVLYELDINSENIDNQSLDILKAVKVIEEEMGRNEIIEYDSYGKRIYHSRIIDIDILLIGDVTIDLPALKVPHPLMYKRDFVMLPLKEILPEHEGQ